MRIDAALHIMSAHLSTAAQTSESLKVTEGPEAVYQTRLDMRSIPWVDVRFSFDPTWAFVKGPKADLQL